MPTAAEAREWRGSGAQYTPDGRLAPRYLPKPSVTTRRPKARKPKPGFKPGMTAGGSASVGGGPRPSMAPPPTGRPIVTSSGSSGPARSMPRASGSASVLAKGKKGVSLIDTAKSAANVSGSPEGKALRRFADSPRDSNKSFGGLVRNFGREAAGFALSGGPMLQLGGEAVAYPFIRAGEAIHRTTTGQRLTLRSQIRVGRAIEGHTSTAGKAVIEDYRYRWFEPLIKGDSKMWLDRAYKAPLSTALDLGGVYSAAGRGSAAAARGAARVTPKTDLGKALARYGDRSVLAPGEVNPATGDISTGGARYRPPKRKRSAVNPTNPDAPFAEVLVHQRPYSVNPVTRAVQKQGTKIGRRVAERVTTKADDAQAVGYRPTTGARIRARAYRPLTGTAQFNRAQTKGAREIRINAEANQTRLLDQLTERYRRSAKPIRTNLPARQTAMLEMRGVLAPRGPAKTRVAARDRYVANVRSEQVREIKETGADLRNSQQQIADIAAIPDDIIEMDAVGARRIRPSSLRYIRSGFRQPIGRQIRENVAAGRELDVKLQQMQMDSGAISPEAAVNATTRHEMVTMGRAPWGPRAARGLRIQARQARTKAKELEQKLLADGMDPEDVQRATADAWAQARTLSAQAEEMRLASVQETTPVMEARAAAAEAQAELGAAILSRQAARAGKSDAYRAAVARRAALPRASSASVFQAGRRFEAARRTLVRTDPVKRAQAKATALTERSIVLRSAGDAPGARRLEAKAHDILTRPVGWTPRSGARERIVGKGDTTPTGKNPAGTGGRTWARPDAERQGAYGSALEAQGTRWRFDQRTKALREAEGEVTTSRVDLARGTPREDKAVLRARKNLRELNKKLRRVENANMGLAPPLEPEYVAGGRGVFVPEAPIDPLFAEGSAPARGGGFSGPGRSKQNTGMNARTGNWLMDNGLLMEQAQRATANYVGTRSPQALKELVGTAAYKMWVPRELAGDVEAFAVRQAGGVEEVLVHATGDRTKMLLASDPDRVVLVNLGTLKGVLERADQLPAGRYLDASDTESLFYGVGDDWLAALPEDALSSDYVAISKAVAETWREVISDPNSILGRYFDRPMSFWKAGLLALSPRWYLNGSVGMAFQYGVMSGLDIKAIRASWKHGPLRDAVPAEIEGSTIAREVGGEWAGRYRQDPGALTRLIEGGFNVNNRLEGFWKRSAYISRSRKALKREGVDVAELTDQELALAIDNMPPSLQRQVIREVDLFIGDYRRMSKFEQAVMRRIFPFWSWLRVIGRLSLTMPFRHPLRTQALNIMGYAASAGINPDDEMRPLHRRGDMNFGGVRIPMQGALPFATVAPFIQEGTRAVGGGGTDPINTGLGLAFSWGNPALQTVAQSAFGVDSFGNPLFAPPGYGGTADSWNGERQQIDPVTGLPRPVTLNRPWLDSAIASVIPGQYNPVRSALSAGQTVYDTTTLSELAQYRLGLRSGDGVVYPRTTVPVSGPSGFGLTRLGVPQRAAQGVGAGVGSFLGIRAYRENPGRLQEDYLSRWGRYNDAVKSTGKKQRQYLKRLRAQGG